MVSSIIFKFTFDFSFFLFFLSTCYSIWLCRYTTINLFVSFHVGDSDNKVVSIK